MRQQTHYDLTKPELVKAKVVFIFAILGLILDRIDKQARVAQANPAVTYCTRIIDQTVDGLKPHAKNEVNRRVNRARVKLTADVRNVSSEAALLAMLNYFEQGKLNYREGTHIAYVVQTLLQNKPAIEHEFSGKQEDVKTFLRSLSKNISKI